MKILGDNYPENIINGEAVYRCTKKDKLTRKVEEEAIKNQSLQVRECYQCDGYEKLCDRYTPENRQFNWLGLEEKENE